MMNSKIVSLTLLAGAVALTALPETARADAPSALGWTWNDAYNDVYFARPHNTYQREHFGSLDWALWGGFHALELDIHESKLVGGVPQFPVKHDSWNSDTGNNCRWGAGGYLRDCLNDIRNWSDYNPGHLPITVQIDLKAISPYAWGDAQYDELHAQVAQVLGNKLYRPNDLRAWTGYDSLRQGVYTYGWPSLGALQGKVIVLIMGGPLGDKNDMQENYVRRYNYNANFFVCPNADSPADFDWWGNANDFDEYGTNKWVVCGNVGSPSGWHNVAARADDNRQLMNLWSGSYEHDLFHRMYLAIGWGASMISRGNAETFGGKLPLVGLRRSVPVEFEIVNDNSNKCLDVWNGSYQNGSDIIQWSCNGDPNQTWIYTGETQLRSLGNSAYCYDIDGGDGDLEDRHHIWKCDGGESEKWRLDQYGSFVGMKGRCMDVPNSSVNDGVQLWHYDCNGSGAQRFHLNW
ncbi:Ca2+-dependent phosphoinositide-specific phospholipase C [Nannocystis sp. SCPEA4]|uniref:Ca2+-dependent phosphoinositide-specific phospholipase C n=1 Tax=Nannocystis sp. SCPEA4 TaxID=2996787 RepID=UPI002271A0BE|nr:Ca2+-dependent phosphoinositide-specific phospholipase C [Nannocystis sp. SCPEA4]MCY1054911.1 Ca2+-dependent phosphoinositide-specific phospholipase C [Nannocystis sp. SCPEA4]